MQSQSTVNAAFDATPWIGDFHELTTAMASHYADLEWALNDRRIDLPKLRQATEDSLRRCDSDQCARHELKKFLDAFGDGHLSIAWTNVSAQSNVEAEADWSLCGRLGYKAPVSPGIDFSLLPGFAAADGEGSKLFSGGLLTLPSGARLGLIRIPSFSEHAFPEECERTIREMHLTDESKCDKKCEQAIELETANRLTAALVMRSVQLRGMGASALLVDVTRNDGGSDWNEAVLRSLSSVPLAEDRRGFIKNVHWTTELQTQLHGVEADLKSGAEPKVVLEEAATRLRLAIAQSKESCDRSRVFYDGRLDCSLVVGDLLFWSGVLPYAKPGSFASLGSRTTLFHPLRYEYSEDAHRLPLYVVVDRHTWSSAERFASLLQDNAAATIIGELTGGAGCGFTNGGIPTTLTYSHAQVRMPDCVGFRKDGSNGNDGVTPDILVPWAERDTLFAKANKLLRALNKAVKKND
ncbi:MAG: S41 family peptidase [Candidatus Sulfotelmatobacter sp.]